MRRLIVTVLCAIGIFAGAAAAQSFRPEPIRAPAGTVLTFYLQTRLHPVSGDAMNSLPEGTILRVKLLDSIDTRVNHDGDEFRGEIVSSLLGRNTTVIQSGADVRGLLALLRSRNHPEGFRYELLITGITDRGKSYAITASLDPTLYDASDQTPAISHPAIK